MPTTHSATQVEQAVAALQPLPRHEQSKTLAQMVFDGALTRAQAQDVLYELCAAELGEPVESEPSIWRLARRSATTATRTADFDADAGRDRTQANASLLR
jgi:hypothetical protein